MLRAKEARTFKRGLSRPKAIFLFSLLFAVVVGLTSYYRDGGIKGVRERDIKLEMERQSVKRLEAENNVLRRKVESIEEGSYLMEKFARENLNLSKENEIVFRFTDEPKPDGEPAPAGKQGVQTE
ncbi:MAG: septum formation initiator family protein [Nitrospinota bacterium]